MKDNKLTTEEMDNLFNMIAKLNFLLGYSMSLLLEKNHKITSNTYKERFKWLSKSVENLVYSDKPLEPFPE